MSVQLTEAQERAIKAPIDQPCLILAAAGSGKTLVLCHRILHLIFQGVAAKNILAVTFSRRAGQDLLHRLHSVATSLASVDSHVLLEGIHVRTFHSFCLTILRAFPSQAGLSPDFVVLTPKMQLQILEDLIRSWYDEKHAPSEGRNQRANNSLDFRDLTGKNNFRTEALRLHQQLRRFASSKMSGCSLSDRKLKLDKHDGLSEWVYNRYHTAVKSINGIDFIDFPRLAGKVLENCQTALANMGMQAHYILVDEFQDTDVDQFQLLRLLCRDHNRLTIVGDDDQQIYTWRGAAGFDNLAVFDKVFHGATITKLEQNFRSTGAIVAAARSVIAKNVHRTPKTIRTASPTGPILTVCECRNEQCEAAAVANFILSLKEQSIPLREIAVLYRVQHVGLELQEMLRARGIPCNSRGYGSGAGEGYPGVFRHQRTSDAAGVVLHDILAILRLVFSEADDLSCKQVMESLCPDFDLSRVSKCVQHLQHQQGISLYKALISARSHFLGLKKQEDLTSCGTGLDQTDEHVVEGLHSLMRILETTKEDLKELRMKDVIMNLLQQISPFRTRSTDRIASKGEGISTKQSIAQRCQDGNIEFAGIKALMREASKFDTEWESEGQDNINRGVARSNGYRNLLQQKTSRQSLRESYKLLSQSSPCKTQNGHIKRLQTFIDHVTLKLHDGELGDCGACSMSSAIDNQNISEAGSLDSVVLSTIHQAKGLEWTAVIIVRANEGVLPLMDRETAVERVIPQAFDSGFHTDPKITGAVSDKSVFKVDTHINKENSVCINGSGEGDIMVLRDACKLNAVYKGRNTALEALEEERRIMYVALTRAKRFLLVTHVMLHGQQSMSPSRFLADIPKGLMHRTTCYDSSIFKSKSETSKQVLDLKISKSSDSYKTSCGVSPSSKTPLKSASSQDIQKGGFQPDTKIKFSKKRQLESGKSASKDAVDVEQSLKDIDDLLDGMTDLATNRKATMFADKNLKGNHKVEVSKGKRRQGYPSRQIIESSSEDSDFETGHKKSKESKT